MQDTNDIDPVMDIATCNPNISVSVTEGEQDGFVIHTVSANDGDATGTDFFCVCVIEGNVS